MLTWAAVWAACEALLDCGASLTERAENGFDALQWAEWRAKKGTARMLRRAMGVDDSSGDGSDDSGWAGSAGAAGAREGEGGAAHPVGKGDGRWRARGVDAGDGMVDGEDEEDVEEAEGDAGEGAMRADPGATALMGRGGRRGGRRRGKESPGALMVRIPEVTREQSDWRAA